MRLYRWIMNQVQRGAIPAYHYRVYVRCDRCGEALSSHIDLRNDLSVQYGEEGQADKYFTRKIIIGSALCFNPIEIELTFDVKRNLTHQSIHAGSFISEEEYLEFRVSTATKDQDQG